MTSSIRHTTSKPFRKDVQVLRGLAVLAVVFYHAGFGSTAGYLGVDAFFVIAGFLMYQQVSEELYRTSSFSVREYLMRRARRLMPLSIGVAILTLLLAIPFSTTHEQLYISAAGVAILIHLTNFFAYVRLGDYFGVDAEAIPLLHYWSLAAEEQLFILFAFSVAILLKIYRRLKLKPSRSQMRLLIIVISLISLALNVYLGHSPSGSLGLRDPASFGFFSPFTRIWQFSLGMLVSISSNQMARPKRIGVLWTAATATLAGLLFSPVSTGWDPIVLQVCATSSCAIILHLGGRSNHRKITKSVTVKTGSSLVARIGDHSYSLYLIHWPLLVFATQLFGPSVQARLTAVALAGVCSVVAFRAIEKPFRSLSIKSPTLIKSLVVGSCALVACSTAVRVGAGLEWGQAVEEPEPLPGSQCTDISEINYSYWCYLRVADAAPTVLMVGDSHATSLSKGFVDAAEMMGFSAAFSARSSCPFSTVVLRGNRARECRGWQEMILQKIGALGPEIVVVVNYETSYQRDPFGRLESAQGERAFTEGEAIRLWREGLATMIARVQDISPTTSVVLVSQVPEMEKFQFRRGTIFNSSPTPVRNSRSETLGPDERFRRASFALAELYEHVYVLDSRELFCDARFCHTGDSEGWWYSDHHHLNSRGSALLGVPLANIFEQALEAHQLAIEGK